MISNRFEYWLDKFQNQHCLEISIPGLKIQGQSFYITYRINNAPIIRRDLGAFLAEVFVVMSRVETKAVEHNKKPYTR